MPRKKAIENFESTEGQWNAESFENNTGGMETMICPPANDGNVPQLHVHMETGAMDVMAQMGSPTANQGNADHKTSPHGKPKEHGAHKHGKHSFEDAQPHGHALRHHHGYNLRERI
jgi:hypothetical protein